MDEALKGKIAIAIAEYFFRIQNFRGVINLRIVLNRFFACDDFFDCCRQDLHFKTDDVWAFVIEMLQKIGCKMSKKDIGDGSYKKIDEPLKGKIAVAVMERHFWGLIENAPVGSCNINLKQFIKELVALNEQFGFSPEEIEMFLWETLCATGYGNLLADHDRQ